MNEENKIKFEIDGELAQKILDYLKIRPYEEVFLLVQEIRSTLKPIIPTPTQKAPPVEKKVEDNEVKMEPNKEI